MGRDDSLAERAKIAEDSFFRAEARRRSEEDGRHNPIPKSSRLCSGELCGSDDFFSAPPRLRARKIEDDPETSPSRSRHGHPFRWPETISGRGSGHRKRTFALICASVVRGTGFQRRSESVPAIPQALPDA